MACFKSRTAIAAVIVLAGAQMTGCNHGPTGVAAPASEVHRAMTYPARPSVAAPAFKVFHHTADSITLVTKEDATDDEVASLIWQIRGAAHAKTLDRLDKSGLVEKMVEARKPIVWLHIYRGTKCAAEKYASGAPPCGGSYHAAGDYTYGDYVKPEWDNGILFHGENETQLWDPDKPYAAPAAGS